MSLTPLRKAVRFDSGSAYCSAWYYPGTNGACIVMAGGFAVTKEPATDLFAARFQQAGYNVLAFDYRGIGDSGGEPRQVLPLRSQLADWRAAITYAGTLPGVDSRLIAGWAFSLSAGHLLRLAAEKVELAAIVAQTPFVGGLTASRALASYQSPLGMTRFIARGLVDGAAGWFRRPPRLVPLAGPRGSVSVLTSPDSQLGDGTLNPDNRYPDWIQAVAARSALKLAPYRPGRYAKRVSQPLLVVVLDDDTATHPGAAVQMAQQAPHSELATFPGGHYSPFLEAHEAVVAAQLDFLQRRVLGQRHPSAPATGSGRQD